MFMFVANASLQIHEFRYRLPEIAKERIVTIRPCSQVRLPDDMNQPQIDAVIKQVEPYGFIDAKEIGSRPNVKKFTRLAYSVGSMISDIKIQALLQGNDRVKVDEGKSIREAEAFVANSRIISELERQKQMGSTDLQVDNIEMTIQQEEPKGGYDASLAKPIGEGYRVENPATADAKPSRRGKR